MEEWLPQEIEVRYIIPAIRGKLAASLVKDKGFSQKKVAGMLGLSEAAVSQYRHAKRGTAAAFSKDILKEIKHSADKIAEEEGNHRRLMAEIGRLCNLPAVKHLICDLHRKQSKDLKDCTICFDEGIINVNIPQAK